MAERIYHNYVGQHIHYYHEWCLDQLDRINVNKRSKRELQADRERLKLSQETWIPNDARCFACKTSIHAIPRGRFVPDAFAPTFIPEEER